MRKLRILTITVALLVLAVASNALSLTVSVGVFSLPFSVGSTNTISGSQLFVDQFLAINDVAPVLPTDSILALGTMQTQFHPPDLGHTGAYTFSAVPANFDIYLVDDANPAHVMAIPVVGTISGTTNVTSLSPPQGNRGLVYDIATINGSAVNGFYNTIIPAKVTTFNFFGVPVTLKIRSVQSPPLFGATPTAIEGTISAVPEPGALGLLLAGGVSASLFAAFRRRRA